MAEEDECRYFNLRPGEELPMLCDSECTKMTVSWAGNPLNSPDAWTSYLPPKLRSLRITNGTLPPTITHLKHLKVLECTQCYYIAVIPALVLDRLECHRLPRLEEIKATAHVILLDGCSLDILPSFDGRFLERLSAPYNNLTEVNPSEWYGLTHLDLQHNCIEYIDFTPMVQLKTANLQHNQLKSFRGWPSDELLVSMNSIGKLPEGISVRKLIACENSLRAIHSCDVEILNVSGNPLQVLYTGTAKQVTALDTTPRVLDLGECLETLYISNQFGGPWGKIWIPLRFPRTLKKLVGQQKFRMHVGSPKFLPRGPRLHVGEEKHSDGIVQYILALEVLLGFFGINEIVCEILRHVEELAQDISVDPEQEQSPIVKDDEVIRGSASLEPVMPRLNTLMRPPILR